MFETPRNQGCVSGTAATCGTVITSPASARRISHWTPPQERPSRDDSTCAAVLVASRDASSCWNARRSSLAARAIVLAESGDLQQKLVAVDGLDDVVARALAHPPDLVRFLAL